MRETGRQRRRWELRIPAIATSTNVRLVENCCLLPGSPARDGTAERCTSVARTRQQRDVERQFVRVGILTRRLQRVACTGAERPVGALALASTGAIERLATCPRAGGLGHEATVLSPRLADTRLAASDGHAHAGRPRRRTSAAAQPRRFACKPSRKGRGCRVTSGAALGPAVPMPTAPALLTP